MSILIRLSKKCGSYRVRKTAINIVGLCVGVRSLGGRQPGPPCRGYPATPAYVSPGSPLLFQWIIRIPRVPVNAHLQTCNLLPTLSVDVDVSTYMIYFNPNSIGVKYPLRLNSMGVRLFTPCLCFDLLIGQKFFFFILIETYLVKRIFHDFSFHIRI